MELVYRPVLEVNRGAIVEFEIRVVEDGLPIADAPLLKAAG